MCGSAIRGAAAGLRGDPTTKQTKRELERQRNVLNLFFPPEKMIRKNNLTYNVIFANI